MPKPLNDETIRQVRAMRADGQTQQTIADALGISRNSVRRILNPAYAEQHRISARKRRAQHTEPPTFDVDAWLNGLGNLPDDGAPLF